MLTIKSLKHQKGLSLIELMISSTLGLILLAGIVQLFLSNKQSYTAVTGASQILDNGRLATYFMSGAVKKAGYWGDVETQPNRSYGADSGLIAGTYTGRFGDSEYLSGANDDATNAVVVDGTDELWIRFNGSTDNPLTNCVGTAVTGTQVAIEHYYLRVASGTESISSLVCETIVLNINLASGEITVPATPSVTTQSLISGVENLQILYGQRNIDSSQIQYFTADNVTNWTWVESARMALLVASTDNVNTVSRISGYSLLDVTSAIPTDKRSRQVFESLAAIRNPNIGTP
jgi:type IV pilus assembly protein PilW